MLNKRIRHSFEQCPLLSKKCLPHDVPHIFFTNLHLFHFRICRTCDLHLINQPLLAQRILDTCLFLGYLLLPKTALYYQLRMLVKPPRGKPLGIPAKESKSKKRILCDVPIYPGISNSLARHVQLEYTAVVWNFFPLKDQFSGEP
ncbi:MAG: hypothetical protein JSV40_11320 [Deltaproteobacteria bacterium]|nr:MAG: hypothetical protein JSV40_11320 [Deltaproteobacteria bacterium]